MFHGVIDLSHHNAVADWARVARAGIAAVIHKATEGATFRDPLFRERRDRARAAGLLWGSYHYTSGLPVADQVANYLRHADPREDELICVDYEDSTSGRTLALGELEAFVAELRDRTGRWPVIYGGRLLREACAGVERSILSNCPLWHARFAAAPVGVPALWPRWTLWQHTDGRDGAPPRTVDGVGPCDRDAFNGSEAELRSLWPL